MYTQRMECPNCRQIGDFPVHGLHEFDVQDPERPERPGVRVRSLSDNDKINITGTSACRLCRSPVMLILRGSLGTLHAILHSVTRDKYDLPTSVRRNMHELELMRSYPPVPKDAASDSFPDSVNQLLKDLHAGRRGGMSPASLIGICRSILERATSELEDGKHARKKLSARINALRDDGLITKALADSAHQVRIDGNAAVHETSGHQKDADELEAFLMQFLDLVYGLPERLRQRHILALLPDQTES